MVVLVFHLAAQSHHSNAQTVSFQLWCTHLHSFGQHAWAVVSNGICTPDKYKSMTEQPPTSLRQCIHSTRLGSQEWHCQVTDTGPAMDMPDWSHVLMTGPLTAQQTDMFMRNQRFAGLKFPDMHRPETLERRFARHLDAEAMSFLT